jgi:hypothetical protein
MTTTTTTPGLTRPPEETTLAQKERCSRCRYWENLDKRPPPRIEDEQLGLCHRYPPVRPRSTRQFEPIKRWLFPIAAAADWCGEYRG